MPVTQQQYDDAYARAVKAKEVFMDVLEDSPVEAFEPAAREYNEAMDEFDRVRKAYHQLADQAGEF